MILRLILLPREPLLIIRIACRTKPHGIKDSKGSPLKVDADLKTLGQDAVLQIS